MEKTGPLPDASGLPLISDVGLSARPFREQGRLLLPGLSPVWCLVHVEHAVGIQWRGIG